MEALPHGDLFCQDLRLVDRPGFWKQCWSVYCQVYRCTYRVTWHLLCQSQRLASRSICSRNWFLWWQRRLRTIYFLIYIVRSAIICTCSSSLNLMLAADNTSLWAWRTRPSTVVISMSVCMLRQSLTGQVAEQHKICGPYPFWHSSISPLFLIVCWTTTKWKREILNFLWLNKFL